MFEYLLFPEREALLLGPKEKLLWESVRRLSKGEEVLVVAKDIIDANILTKGELRAWSSWLKKNPPERKTRPIDVFRGNKK